MHQGCGPRAPPGTNLRWTVRRRNRDEKASYCVPGRLRGHGFAYRALPRGCRRHRRPDRSHGGRGLRKGFREREQRCGDGRTGAASSVRQTDRRPPGRCHAGRGRIHRPCRGQAESGGQGIHRPVGRSKGRGGEAGYHPCQGSGRQRARGQGGESHSCEGRREDSTAVLRRGFGRRGRRRLTGGLHVSRCRAGRGDGNEVRPPSGHLDGEGPCGGFPHALLASHLRGGSSQAGRERAHRQAGAAVPQADVAAQEAPYLQDPEAGPRRVHVRRREAGGRGGRGVPGRVTLPPPLRLHQADQQEQPERHERRVRLPGSDLRGVEDGEACLQHGACGRATEPARRSHHVEADRPRELQR